MDNFDQKRPAVADTPFTRALIADMERLGLKPRALAQRMDISQQAVQKWLHEGALPLRRVSQLKEALGHGEVSALPLEQIVSGASGRRSFSSAFMVNDDQKRPAVADTPFNRALFADMERRFLSPAGLGRLMGITQQAVQKWLHEGEPPLSRVAELKKILGPGEVSALALEQIVSVERRGRTARSMRTGNEANLPAKDKLQSSSELVIKELETLLPEDLLDRLSYRWDSPYAYVSDSLTLAFAELPKGLPHSALTGALDLMAVREFVAPEDSTIALVIISNPNAPISISERDEAGLRAHGIDVWRCGSVAELSDKIVEAEEGARNKNRERERA